MTSRRIGAVLVAIAALTVAAYLVPATADWLVTKDGDRIETQGPWKVESRLVVFKRPNGSYASMRLSEIDLEASERLTLEMAETAKRPKEVEAREPQREPVARLTEKDLPPVGRRRPAEERESPSAREEASSAPTETEESSPQAVEVSTWREVTTSEDPGVAFVGEIRNPTDHMAVGVTVTVTVYDAEDEELASTTAVLSSDTVPPRKNGAFRASFPGVFYYARADFDVSADLLLSDRPEGEDGETEEPPPS